MNFTQKIDFLLQDDNFKLSKSILYVKNLVWIPLAKIEKDRIYIFFSTKLKKQTLKLINLFRFEDLYLISYKLSNPKLERLTKEEKDKINIENYLRNFANFFNDFKKTKFDLLENFKNYCSKEDCFYLVKEIYEQVNKEVQKSYYDWYNKKYIYNYPEEVREVFSIMYRDIVISEILNNS